MEWININISATRSPEFLGAEPDQRGTWLSLISLCCIQENSGVIENCRKLKCRAWQQLAGVTLEEVNAECELFHWEGDDLHVNFYPIEQQELLQKKRKGGAAGGRRSGKTRAKKTAQTKDSLKEKQSTPSSSNEGLLEGDLEGKVKESKVREGKEKKSNTPIPPKGDLFPHSRISSIVSLYPRRERTMECERVIAEHLENGISADAIIAGTKAIAAIIPQLPSGAHNAYLPGALTFFRNRRWEDDPQTWLRQATIAKENVEKNNPAPVSLGGFTPSPDIEI